MKGFGEITMKWHKFRLWVIRNGVTVLLALLLFTGIATVALTALALAKTNEQAQEARENINRQLEQATAEMEVLKKEFQDTRDLGHNERVEIIKYIRCILLLPRTEATRANPAKALDSCLEGSLRRDVVREQRFLAQ